MAIGARALAAGAGRRDVRRRIELRVEKHRALRRKLGVSICTGHRLSGLMAFAEQGGHERLRGERMLASSARSIAACRRRPSAHGAWG